ncbi:MAG: ATP-dependent sacrificial sulfur transferase LarE [Lachnospiraceae bacterium]|nr:ATP-dependent sacrificial sulfur transferase LarE [Lachnospiraceae bacterium]
MLNSKLDTLKKYIKDLGSVAVAYSAGVDSTFLLKLAHDILGDDCIALTSDSKSFPQGDKREALSFCRDNNIHIITFDANELEYPDYYENSKDRCYYCKKLIFTKMLKIVKEEGSYTLIEGSNTDDDLDYRPGKRALQELNIKSPLKECGFSKAEIRELSYKMGLPTWNKPSFACLASRIPYGEIISSEKLEMIEASERILKELSFRNYRVRLHNLTNKNLTNNDFKEKDRQAASGPSEALQGGNKADKWMARIEIEPDEMGKILETSTRLWLVEELKALGFSYVTLDLLGYRSGSLNEILPKNT